MLEVKGVTKLFENLKAVDGIYLEVKEGSFYGLLGPNGAGKTTTINMISTLLKPDSGTIYLNGKDIYLNKKLSKMTMGVVPQEIALYEDMSAYDNLIFFGSLYGLKGAHLKQKADYLLQWMELENRKTENIKKYSGGMKRRINIASSLLHDPQIIIMDEPTVGIDPQSRNKIYDILKNLHKQGKSILYTTHYMQEAEDMCDKIGIIDKGKLVAEGSFDELKMQNTLEESITILFAENNSVPDFSDANYKYVIGNNEITFFSKNVHNDLPLIINYCNTKNAHIKNVEIKTVSLETIFLKLTGKQLRE